MSLKNFLAIVLFVIPFVVGCRPVEANKVADINPLGWRSADTAIITVNNTDTLSLRNISLVFRMDGTFSRQQIPLSIRIDTPDSLWHEELFTARFIGTKKTESDFHEFTIPYRRNTLLNRPGPYSFKIATTEDNIHGIWGVGIITDDRVTK